MNQTIPTIKLANGVVMPQIGYGVYQVTPDECRRCVLDALDVGYRMIDTAQAYGNEAQVGEAWQASGLKREDLFLVTKMWMSQYDKGQKSIDESLRKLKTDYIDLMILHQPFCDRYSGYRALEEAYKAGKLRAIGVSNHFADHFIDLASNVEIPPMVNQMETHVFDQQTELRKYEAEFHCAPMAWSPMAEARNGFFTNATLKAIGDRYGKSIAQIGLRYLLQLGVIIIPKSTHKARMAENLNLFDFELSSADMAELAKLDTQTSVFFDHHAGETAKMFMGFRSLV